MSFRVGNEFHTRKPDYARDAASADTAEDRPRHARVHLRRTLTVSVAQPPALMRQGEWVITAANGDELQVHVMGTVETSSARVLYAGAPSIPS